MARDIKIGTIFKCHKPYSSRRDGQDKKERWFIYLGKTGLTVNVSLPYLVTTTTNYATTTLSNNTVIEFKESDGFGFLQNCIADIKHIVSNSGLVTIEQLINNTDLWEIKGRLNEKTLKEIWNKILYNKEIRDVYKKDIYNSFQTDGITNIAKPR